MTLCMWPHVYLTPTLSKSVGDEDPHARSLTYANFTVNIGMIVLKNLGNKGTYTCRYFCRHLVSLISCKLLIFLCTYIYRDTAGQERFRDITQAYYRGSMVSKRC